MTLLVLLTTTFSALAVDDAQECGPSEEFIAVCGNFFASYPQVAALDKQGNDVSASFYQEHLGEYQSQDYPALWQAFLQELSAMSWDTIEEKPSTRAIMNLTATKTRYIAGATQDHMPQATFEMMFSVSGTYAVSDGTREIISCSNAAVNIEYMQLGTLFSYSMVSPSTNSYISADRKNVYFTGQFTLNISHVTPDPFPGVIVWTESLGPYSETAVGYVN